MPPERQEERRCRPWMRTGPRRHGGRGTVSGGSWRRPLRPRAPSDVAPLPVSRESRPPGAADRPWEGPQGQLGTGPGRALGPPDLWTHRRHARGPPMAHLEEQPLTRGPQSFLDLSDQNANSVGFLFSSSGTAAPGQSSEASYSKAGVRAQRRGPRAPGLLPETLSLPRAAGAAVSGQARAGALP